MVNSWNSSKIVNDNIWKVIIFITFPIAMYNLIEHFYSVIDAIIVSNISDSAIGSILFTDQLKLVFSAISTGLAIGVGIIVARYMGKGNLEKAQKYNSTILVIGMGLSLLSLIIIPFAIPILKFANAPPETINEGVGYFIIQIIGLIPLFLNVFYMAIERVLGNSKKIFIISISSISIKVILTLFVVNVLGMGLNAVAMMTLISQLFITMFALRLWFGKKSILRFQVKDVHFNWKFLIPIIVISLPLIFQRFAFNLGKSIVYSMVGGYFGTAIAITAIGVSSKLGGITTSFMSGYESGCTSILSHNIGAGKNERIKKIVIRSFIISIVWSLFVLVIVSLTIDWLALLFMNSPSNELLFAIKAIFKWEKFGGIPLTMLSVILAYLYALGKTKYTLLINGARVFLFRIPAIYFFVFYLDLGYEGVGMALLFSHVMVVIFAFIILIYAKYKGMEHYDFENR